MAESSWGEVTRRDGAWVMTVAARPHDASYGLSKAVLLGARVKDVDLARLKGTLQANGYTVTSCSESKDEGYTDIECEGEKGKLYAGLSISLEPDADGSESEEFDEYGLYVYQREGSLYVDVADPALAEALIGKIL